MASPKVVTTNPDLPRQSSVCSLSSLLAEAEEPSKTISMDDLLKSIYSSSSEPNPEPPPAATTCVPKEMMGSKTMEEVWKEMVTGTGTGTGTGTSSTEPQPQPQPQQDNKEITLEDFLTKAAVTVPVTDHDVTTAIIPPHPHPPPPAVVPNGTAVAVPVVVGGGGGGGGRRRGKKRAVAVEEPVVDKATLQKQRRMIKNRESAARSRERKQAYTLELESLVVHLEAENARFLSEQAEKNRQRYKQLMECLIPVVEKRKPRRTLRRVNSVQW